MCYKKTPPFTVINPLPNFLPIVLAHARTQAPPAPASLLARGRSLARVGTRPTLSPVLATRSRSSHLARRLGSRPSAARSSVATIARGGGSGRPVKRAWKRMGT
jgi:hypothetical protein